MKIYDIITIIISIAGLLGVIYQSMNLRATINSQIYQNFVANSLEIDRILIEYPYLRKYVYGEESVTEETENLDQIMSFIELVNDITENIEIYKKYIPASRRKGWMAYVEDVKGTSAYHFYMRRYGDWYAVEEHQKNDKKEENT